MKLRSVESKRGIKIAVKTLIINLKIYKLFYIYHNGMTIGYWIMAKHVQIFAT